jgi:hypothetical protein
MRSPRSLSYTALLALLATACVDKGGSLVIVQAQVPDETCAIAGMPTEARRDHGVLDVGLDRGYPYMLFPLVANALPKVGEKFDIEPNRVNVLGARVRIEPPPGVFVPWRADCPQEFDYPSQATLEPGAMASLIVEALRGCHAEIFKALFQTRILNASLSDQVFFRAVVRARGRHGGDEVLSEPFEFPIRVCYGCLQSGFQGVFAQFNFPATPACDLLGEHPYTGNPCGPAQDFGPLLCCALDPKAERLECPARPRVPGTGTK